MLPCRESWGEAAPGLKGMGWGPGEWRALQLLQLTFTAGVGHFVRGRMRAGHFMPLQRVGTCKG